MLYIEAAIKLLVISVLVNKSECSLKSFLGLLDSSNVTATYKDFFIGDKLSIKCVSRRTLIPGNNTKDETDLHWVFYNNKGKSTKYNSTAIMSDIIIEDSPHIIKLHIPYLTVAHSGRYDCTKKINHKHKHAIGSWKIQVHDVDTMHYVLLGRGQTTYEDTEVDEFKVGMQWSNWTACDGCGGLGERRKFGFCYVTWSLGKEQCQSKQVPSLLKPVARGRREEIVVEVCYDQCEEEETPVFIQNERVEVTNGANLKLYCGEKIHPYSTVRWMRGFEVLKRTDVSMGLYSVQAYYVAKNNSLWIHDIDKPEGGIIKVSCVIDRSRRMDFDIAVEPVVVVGVTSFIEHLYWIGLTSSLQATGFIVIMATITAYKSVRDQITVDI